MSCSVAAATCSGLSRTASRPGVELRMQRLDAAVHDLREAGEVLDRADVEARARRAPAPCRRSRRARRRARRGRARSRRSRACRTPTAAHGGPGRSRLGEWLPGSVEACSAMAPSIGEARVSERVSRGTTGRYAVNPHRRLEHGATTTTDPERELERSGDELEERIDHLDDHIDDVARRRRRAVRSPGPARTPPGTGRTRTTTPAARTPRASTTPRPTRTRRTRTRSPAPRRAAPPRVRQGRGATAPRAMSATASRQELVLDRAQRRRGRPPGRVASGSSIARLQDDRAGVDALVDEVDGHPEDLHAVVDRLLDRAHAREGGQQRRVDVDDPVGEAGHEAGVEERHVAGEHDQLDAALDEPVGHRGVARRAIPELRAREDRASPRPPPRARSSARAPGWSEATATISTSRPWTRVEQRLEVRALARGEDADPHRLRLAARPPTRSFG